MLDTSWIDDLDGDAACEAVASTHRAQLEAEAVMLRLAWHWTDLHNGDALDASGNVLPGMERARQLGGAGTPRVAEFCTAEFGALQNMGYISADNYLRDALDLRFRHPIMGAAVLAGRARLWQARKVAQAAHTAGLSLEQALWVDAQTTHRLAGLPWATFLDLVEAKIIEADPAAAQARRDAEAMERFVRTGQCNAYGLKTIIAKGTAGDAIFFVAMCDRIAQILALRGDGDPVDVRRSKAIGILANPARALSLLQDYAAIPDPDQPPADDTDSDGDSDASGDCGGSSDSRGADDAGTGPGADGEGTGGDTDSATRREPVASSGSGEPDLFGTGHVDHAPGTGGDVAGAPAGGDAGALGAAAGEPASEDPGERVGEGDLHPAENDADDPPPQTYPCPTCHGDGVVAGDPTTFVKPMRVDSSKLLPPATLYLHMSQDSFTRDATGVVRFEGVGPILPAQAKEFLGHCHVTIKPVIDVAGQAPVDGYEVPDQMTEALHLRNPRDVFPHATSTSRRKDKDHTVPYVAPDDGGPPGQTHLGNLGPLARFSHRLKTHGRWRLRQPEPGVFLWRSPHGWIWLVDHTGTRALGRTGTARVLWESSAHNTSPTSPTVDLIPADDILDHEPHHVA